MKLLPTFLAVAAATLSGPMSPLLRADPPAPAATPPALTPDQIRQLPPIPIPDANQRYEYIILNGGPSLLQWEKYKTSPHDQFWGGFVRAARTRVQQLEAQLGNNPNAIITWLIYVEGYRSRARQEQQDLISDLYSVRDKYHLHMVPIANGNDVINYLNAGQPRDQIKIADFEYFGHSNRACFMFDYSNNIDSASKSWLHENDLAQLHRNLFVRNAFVKSWGCHTGEEMSKKFYEATGTRMIGAIGRTDYSARDEALNGVIPALSSPDGKWTN